jgi:C-terminal processing protease CtpA/Prc
MFTPQQIDPQMRYLFLLLFLSTSTLAQPLTDTQKLVSLAKVWGYLKYYHPAVAAGKLDWDAQLISWIPTVQQIQSRDQLSAFYETVLNDLGPVASCRKCPSEVSLPAENRRNLDLSFLTDSSVFTPALQSRLTYIRDNRNQGDNVFVQRVSRVGNTSYEHEKVYADMPVPDTSYRMLALFRYWNIVQYFFPYKYAIDGGWNRVLPELIPVFQQATTESDYQQALYRLVARIQDSHGFMTSIGSRCLRCYLGKGWLPVDLTLIDNKAIVTRLYTDSITVPPALTVGTVISHIDGEPIQTRADRLRPYVSASNEQTLERDVRNLIGVGTASEATLTIDLGGRDTTVTVTRYPYSKLGQRVRTSLNSRNLLSRWIGDSIGYVNLGKLTSKQVDSVMVPLLGARAIIFDLRNYPQGTYWLAGRYLTDRSAPFAQFTGPDLRFPGVFQVAGNVKASSSGKQRLYAGKVIVLIDEETQSHAEFTAMAFRTRPDVTFVGSPTAGADGNISWIPLPGGYRTAFSGIGVYYPDGKETQRVGILPDVPVRPTIDGIRQGRDEVLERALQLVQQPN